LLYATKYEIEANTDGYIIDQFQINNNRLYLYKDSTLITQFTTNQLSGFQGATYELTTQKELLLKYEKICEIVVRLVEALLTFEEFFDIQYISFLLLKRVYFNFPKFEIFVEDSLVKVLFNLCHFKDKVAIPLYRIQMIIYMKQSHLLITCLLTKV
jgi:hypothetical protein